MAEPTLSELVSNALSDKAAPASSPPAEQPPGPPLSPPSVAPPAIPSSAASVLQEIAASAGEPSSSPLAIPPAPETPAAPENSAPVDLVPEATAMDATGLKAGDLGNAIIGAGRDAVQGTWDIANDLAPKVSRWAERNGLNVLGLEPIRDGQTLAKLPEVPRADEHAGIGAVINAGRDIGRFVLGFVGGQRILQGVGVATSGTAAAIAAGTIGDFLVTGKDDGRLADIVEKMPALRNPITEALASDPEDTVWQAKLKAAAEGFLTGAAIEGLTKFLQVASRSIRLGRDEGEQAAAEYLNKPETLDELSAAAAKLDPPSPHGEAGPNPADLSPMQRHPDQLELFPESIKRPGEDDVTVAIHPGESEQSGAAPSRWRDPETGEERPIAIKQSTRDELAALGESGVPLHLDRLSPEARNDILDAMRADPMAARFFSPNVEQRGSVFALGERKADFDAALERSLAQPYGVTKATAPGTALEDTLGTFFNYGYMDGPDAVKAGLSNLAEAMSPRVTEMIGDPVQSFAKVQELADWLGVNPTELAGSLQNLAGGADKMPAMVVAGKAWIQSLTNDVLRLAKLARSGMATDTAKLELERRKAILGDLIATVKSVQTAAARTTAAGRIRTAARYTPEDVKELADAIGKEQTKFVNDLVGMTEGNPKELIKLLEPTRFEKTMGVVNEFWINALLSGPTTHVVNFTSNTVNGVMLPLYRITGGALTLDQRSIRLGIAQYAALKGAVLDSLRIAGKAFRTDSAYLDASAKQTVEGAREAPRWIAPQTFGLSDTDTVGTALAYLGETIRLPSRFLTTADEFSKQMSYRASVSARARLEAYDKELSDKVMVPYFVDGVRKERSVVDDYVSRALDAAFDPVTGAAARDLETGKLLQPEAMADARRATFTSELKQATWFGRRTSADSPLFGDARTLAEIVQNAAAYHPVVRHLFLPFVRVPANIFREFVSLTPASPLRAQFWDDIRAGGERRSDAIGRLALGSTLGGLAAMYAAEGLITGKGPSDPQLNRQWRAAGNQPYSIRIPGGGADGKDLFISYNRLDPLAGVLGVVADTAYLMGHADERQQDALAVNIALSLANNLNSRGYLQSLTDLMAAIGGSGGHDAAAGWKRIFNSRAASYVPRIVAAANPDDVVRQIEGPMSAMEAKIPGLSTSLGPMRDNFGAVMVTPAGWPWRAINPFTVAVGRDGPARKEMAEWAEGPTRTQFAMPAPTLQGIDLRSVRNATTGQSAYDRWLELLTEPRFNGKTAEENLNVLVKGGGYQAIKKNGVADAIYQEHPAAKLIQEALRQHYKTAQAMMLGEPGFEDLRAALQAQQYNAIAVPRGGTPKAMSPDIADLLKGRRQ